MLLRVFYPRESKEKYEKPQKAEVIRDLLKEYAELETIDIYKKSADS